MRRKRLKRRVAELELDLEYYRNRNQELQRALENKLDAKFTEGFFEARRKLALSEGALEICRAYTKQLIKDRDAAEFRAMNAERTLRELH